MSEYNKGDIVSIMAGAHAGEWGVVVDPNYTVEGSDRVEIKVDVGDGVFGSAHEAYIKMIKKFESYEEKLERILTIADYSESTDALILAGEIYRLREELATCKEGSMLVHEKVTRVEVVENTGRAYTCYNAANVVTSLQDQGRTLKVFLNVEEEE